MRNSTILLCPPAESSHVKLGSGMAFVGSAWLVPRRSFPPRVIRGVRRVCVCASIGGDVSVGFVQVCAGPKPYTDAIQEFIASVATAFRKGYSITALQYEMQMEKPAGGREIQADELEYEDGKRDALTFL